MQWFLKCAAFHALARVPGGDSVYRLAQRHVTRNHLFHVSDAYLRTHQYHVDQYRHVHPGRVLEFGGGRHFLTPLLLSNAGAVEVLVYDIQRLATTEQINHTIRQLRGRVGGKWREIRDWAELESTYRIKYMAPGDARDTRLPEGHVHAVCTTSTLEHIPSKDIRSIHQECLRIAAPQAIFSHIVDYADHYYYSDSSLSPVNFYRFSEFQWKFLNPSNHFQNRLRHSDYLRLFDELGLLPVEIKTGEFPHHAMQRLPVHPSFRHYNRQDLCTSIGYFSLARKPLGSHSSER